MGRANRFLAGRVTAIADRFSASRWRRCGHARQDAVITGNPVRPSVLAAAQAPYPGLRDGSLRAARHRRLAGRARDGRHRARGDRGLAAGSARARPHRAAGARGGRGARARGLCAPWRRRRRRSRSSPICRSASRTPISSSRAPAPRPSRELAVIGRPAILVPYPFALDHDQAANAAELAETRRRDCHPPARFHAAMARREHRGRLCATRRA